MEKKPHHLFVVEDDPTLREMLSSYLGKQGLAVTDMSSAADLLGQLDRLRPDLVILDVNLPGMSGLQACQKLRAEGDRLPIILLTARTDETDRVQGLEKGADGYLGRPFSARESLARVRAVLRRRGSNSGLPQDYERAISIGPCTFMPASRCLLDGGGRSRVLSSVEHSLLTELVINPSAPISRERPLAASNNRSGEVLVRSIDVAVMRLRKLVEPDPVTPRYIQTVRGHGYMFMPGRPRAPA